MNIGHQHPKVIDAIKAQAEPSSRWSHCEPRRVASGERILGKGRSPVQQGLSHQRRWMP
jgi:glutamate-1-semialdehyde aminotransferase